MADLTDVEVFTEPATGPGTAAALTSADFRTHLQAAANRTRWLHERLNEVIGTPQAVEAINAGTDVLTITGHGYNNTDPVRFTSVGGSVPGGLAAGTIYYVRDKTADTFKVAATSGGSAIDITGIGSGVVYAWSVPNVSLWAFILLATDNTWTGPQTFSTSVLFTGSDSLEVEVDADFRGVTAVERLVDGEYDTTTITGTTNLTIDRATARCFRAATPTGNRIISVATAGASAGDRVRVVRPATGNFTYTLRTLGSSDDIVVLAALSFCSADLIFDGAAWQLEDFSPNAVPGAVA